MLPLLPSAPLPPRRRFLPPRATPAQTSEVSRHTSRLRMPTHKTQTRRASSVGRAHRPALCRAQGKSDSERSPWCTALHRFRMMRVIDMSESPRRHGGVVTNERTTARRMQVKHPIAVPPPPRSTIHGTTTTTTTDKQRYSSIAPLHSRHRLTSLVERHLNGDQGKATRRFCTFLSKGTFTYYVVEQTNSVHSIHGGDQCLKKKKMPGMNERLYGHFLCNSREMCIILVGQSERMNETSFLHKILLIDMECDCVPLPSSR